jgi:hypothetical protein
MAQNIVPMIGSSGVFTLNVPWNQALIPNAVYTCVGVQGLTEIVSAGGSPFTDYYTPMGLTQADYNTDVQNGVSIVTLQASNNSIVNVPSSYIGAYPSSGGVPYRVMMLSISLSAIPDTLDLTAVSQKIQDDVMDMIGVTSTVRSVAVSPMTLVDATDAAAIEAARLANITASTTDYANYLTAQANYEAALVIIQNLEAYILAQTNLGGEWAPPVNVPSPGPNPTPSPTPVLTPTPAPDPTLPTATPVPTPTPTPSPTTTVIPLATPTPSPTPTPTPTATPVPTVTPTPTASATPAPTVTPTPSAS